jgi:chromosomal replication initiation ATPase DnaA
MAAMVRGLQMALALPHAESFARDDFIARPSNAAALALIDRWPDWPHKVVALVGPEGSGKSHLATIWAERAGGRFLSPRGIGASDLTTAFATGALVIEDIAPADVDEAAFFHLINIARDENAYLLLTARSSPATWPIGLPDLMSRLRAAPVVTLAPPDDALLRALMMKLAADRQIECDDALLDYLLRRIERSFAGVRAAIADLDREALRQHRPVSRALAAELFRDDAA